MKHLVFLILCSFFISCSNTNKMNQITEPVAKKEAKILSTHGDDRLDNYFWMRLSDQQKEALQIIAGIIK